MESGKVIQSGVGGWHAVFDDGQGSTLDCGCLVSWQVAGLRFTDVLPGMADEELGGWSLEGVLGETRGLLGVILS